MFRYTLARAALGSAAAAKLKSGEGGGNGLRALNRISLVGIVHDIQTGFLHEVPVTQFTLTSNSYHYDSNEVDINQKDAGANNKKDSDAANKSATGGVVGKPNATSPTAPAGSTSSSSSSSSSSAGSTFIGKVSYDRDNFTVRVIGNPLADQANSFIGEGFIIKVTGRWRMNPQHEPAQNRERLFPYLQIGSASSHVAAENSTPAATTDKTKKEESGDQSPAEQQQQQQTTAEDIFQYVEVLSGSKRKARLGALHKGVESVLSESSRGKTSSVVNTSTADKASPSKGKK